MNTKSAVEAALFSSSEPIRLQDIAERISVPVEEVRYAVKDLMAEYEERDSAITIIKVGSEYRMKLRDEYTEFAGQFMRLDLLRTIIKGISIDIHTNNVNIFVTWIPGRG